MILAETWYKTYNGKLLTIVEPFKTCHNYSKNCKHDVQIIMDDNNPRQLIDTKSLWCN